MKKAIVLCSGGVDSVTLAHFIQRQGAEPILISVDYGQNMVSQERHCAHLCAARLKCEIHDVALVMDSIYGESGSALTDPSVEVPSGEYTREALKTTVVPNRNAILANIGVAAAVSMNARSVALALHAGDHPLYVDCRPSFVGLLYSLVIHVTGGRVIIDTPFLHKDKKYIVQMGDTLGVPFKETWSCYKGGEMHCGVCSTCVERKDAFLKAWVSDPTEYAA